MWTRLSFCSSSFRTELVMGYRPPSYQSGAGMKLGFTNRWTGFYRLRSCAPLYLVKLISKQKIHNDIMSIQWSLLLMLFPFMLVILGFNHQ